MHLDTGFRPSRHGFGFANTWRDLLLGVITSRGRCGGMVFAALDAFLAGAELTGESRSATLPAHDSGLARFIWKRQVHSVMVGLGSNLWKFARFTYVPTASVLGVGVATRRELLVVFDALRVGRPAPLGLVSGIGLRQLARNHQVLAYAAQFDANRTTIRIYDPNHPRRDDVTLDVPMDPNTPILEYIGVREKSWRGFFVERYSPMPGKA